MAITIPGTSEPIGSVDYATNAGHATTADTATSATTAGHATTAGSANTATNAGHATTADKATSATSAYSASHLDWNESFQSRDIVVETVNSGTLSVTGSNRFSAYVDIQKTGYTPIALLGYELSGFGVTMVGVNNLHITNSLDRAYCGGMLAESTTTTYNVKFSILYVKTS